MTKNRQISTRADAELWEKFTAALKEVGWDKVEVLNAALAKLQTPAAIRKFMKQEKEQ